MKTIILALALACTAATKPTGLVEEEAKAHLPHLRGARDDPCCIKFHGGSALGN